MARLWYFGLHQPSVAYAATTLAANLMSSVFMFYYVKVYLNRFHVSEWWFQFSQVVFMVWNAINDPLFGYMQDNMNFAWVKSRRHSILYGAPLFVLSFVLPWFPWGNYTSESVLNGIQLVCILCFYDALFTFVLLAQCALFAEMSKKTEDRLRLIRYSQVGGLIGSSSVFFCEMVSGNLQNYPAFLISCVLIAGISWVCLTYTGRTALTEYDLQLLEGSKVSRENKSDELSLDKSTDFSWWQQTLQIFSQASFVSFVLMNFCQIFHTTFLSNFTGIICDQIIPKDMIPSEVRSIFHGLLFLLPQVLVIFGAPVVRYFGYFSVIRASFVLKIVMGIGMFMIGQQYLVLMAFFLMDSACANATFSLFNLCLSDIVDHDIEKYQRKHPLSSMVFGTNALVTKPAISFAPMLAVAILNRHGYEAVKSATAAPPIITQDLNWTMFKMTCAVPVFIGIIQLVVWSRYTFRNTHKTETEYVEA